jgi:hypothetical protein
MFANASIPGRKRWREASFLQFVIDFPEKDALAEHKTFALMPIGRAGVSRVRHNVPLKYRR